MKCYLVFLQLCCCFFAKGQLLVGPAGLFVKTATDFSCDGLTLWPSSDFTLSDNLLIRSPISLPGSPPSIDRLYVFTQAITYAGRLGLHYELSELNGNTEAKLRIVHKNIAATVSAGSVLNSLLRYIYNDIESAQLRTVTAAEQGALPVTLVSFVAKREEGMSRLSWSTSDEYASDYFEIERSNYSKKWHSVGRVEASENSYLARHYDFVDKSPLDGVNQYRLKMVDQDGSYIYSGMRVLHFGNLSRINVYPNPVMEQLFFTVGNWPDVSGIKLISTTGQIYAEDLCTLKQQSINMSPFTSGMYYVRIDYRDGSREFVKVIRK